MKEDEKLWESGFAPFKLKCDHCGAVIDAGLWSVCKHNTEDCTAIRKITIGNYTHVYSPYFSFSKISTDENNRS